MRRCQNFSQSSHVMIFFYVTFFNRYMRSSSRRDGVETHSTENFWGQEHRSPISNERSKLSVRAKYTLIPKYVIERTDPPKTKHQKRYEHLMFFHCKGKDRLTHEKVKEQEKEENKR